jgi:glycosyltransferase involved in cell wall biosynthesis
MWEGPDTIRKDGVRVCGVCPYVDVYAKGRRSVGVAVYFGWRLLVPLLKERFDVANVSVFPYFPCFSAKLAAIVHRSTLIISCWEIWGNYWTEYLGKLAAFGMIAERLTIKLPDWMVVETEDTKKGLVEWGFNSGRISLVPSGVDNKAIRESPTANKEDEADAIYVGRLVEYKGVHIFVEAIGILRRLGKMVKASVVGDGPEMGRLRQLARDLEIDDRVRFYGRIEDGARVISLMKAAKMFVYPAAPLGGWALTPLEANAAGLPVISTRSGPVVGTNEVIRDGYNGFLLAEATPWAMADKIAFLLENPEVRERMRRQALEFANRYDWDKQTESIEDVYSGLVRPRT